MVGERFRGNDNARTLVKTKDRNIEFEEFKVKVGVHQGLVL